MVRSLLGYDSVSSTALYLTQERHFSFSMSKTWKAVCYMEGERQAKRRRRKIIYAAEWKTE